MRLVGQPVKIHRQISHWLHDARGQSLNGVFQAANQHMHGTVVHRQINRGRPLPMTELGFKGKEFVYDHHLAVARKTTMQSG